jgi:hypothetical protein
MRNPTPTPPLHPRLVALLVFALGVVGMAINEWMSAARSEVYLIAILACPTMVLLSAGGLVDPRVLWSLGPHRKNHPMAVRVVGIALLVLGLACSVCLGLWRYPLFPIG